MLTILVGNNDSRVRVLQWFGTVMGCALVSPCGPLLKFEANEFRRVGLEVIRQHFIEFRTRRLTKDNAIEVFTTRAEKRTLANQRAILVAGYDDGRIRLMPMEIQKLSLSGLKCLPEEVEEWVPPGASEDEFWQAFDRALANAV